LSVSYLPEVDALFLITGNGVSIIGLSDFVSHAVTISGSFASGFGQYWGGDVTFKANSLASDRGVAGVQWDASRHRFVLWSNATNRAQISTLTPGSNYFTDPWTAGSLAVNASNATVPSAVGVNGVYGRFAISPSYDGVFLLNSVSEPVFFYAFS
jgi:hypothetical protein